MRLQERVVYIVVDGMGTDAFEQAIASGRAPAFAFLKEHGSYVRDSVAIFPTITPAATASLLTGATPARHGIPGMCWYDRDAQRYVNYGQSPRAAVTEGVAQVVRDVLLNLNSRHLSRDVETIHEQLDRWGLSTASINFMLFRGPYMHDVETNRIARMLFGKELPEQIPGPREHYWGDVVSGDSGACSGLLTKRGIRKRLQLTDDWAACVTRDLLEKGAARMILFYLHENDHLSHRHGPGSQVENIARADQHLAHVLDAFESWERAIEEVGFVVTADHAQSPISSEPDHILDLGQVLADFKQVKSKKGKQPFDPKTDLAAAGNGRVGFIYLNPEREQRLREPVVAELLESPGVDQVMWRDGETYVVRTRRGHLRFREAEAEGLVDERGNKWTFAGDLEAVSGVVEGNDVRTPEYPLALWRIKSALDLDRIGDIVFTTKLTYGIKDIAGADHRGGGDHASLHAQDSLVPFLSTLDEPPLHPATVDVVPHIVDHFRRLRRT